LTGQIQIFINFNQSFFTLKIKMLNKIIVSMTLLVCVSVVGCKPKLPDGMPTLYPCTITITQEGSPLSGASVTLNSLETSDGKTWVPGGMTDSNGIANIKVLGAYSGAPVGTYKVTVKKNGTEEVTNNSFYTLSFVEDQYTNVQKTPLEIEVTTEGTKQTFDAGKITKQRISGLIKLDSSP
jgi:hypothetical protein